MSAIQPSPSLSHDDPLRLLGESLERIRQNQEMEALCIRAADYIASIFSTTHPLFITYRAQIDRLQASTAMHFSEAQQLQARIIQALPADSPILAQLQLPPVVRPTLQATPQMSPSPSSSSTLLPVIKQPEGLRISISPPQVPPSSPSPSLPRLIPNKVKAPEIRKVPTPSAHARSSQKSNVISSNG